MTTPQHVTHARAARPAPASPRTHTAAAPPAAPADDQASNNHAGSSIADKAYANAEDVLIAWQPAHFEAAWVGFSIERRDDTMNTVVTLPNRIPPHAGQGPVQPAGLSSAESPIRRCIWTDHSVAANENVSYRVTAMVADGQSYKEDPAGVSAWTPATAITGDAGDGLAAFFNRGTLMSQIVSRFVKGEVTSPVLHNFVAQLKTPGFPARRYLSGDALHEILLFLGESDRRGSEIYAAIYEINDQELVDALKPFGKRGHIIIGNGSATEPSVSTQLVAAGLDVHHRDLSHRGASSPSVHNKFVVEVAPPGTPRRVLTGSTNWTVTGLCTQLNNVLIVERQAIAERFRDQWQKLADAGDKMTPELETTNTEPTTDGGVSVYFAASKGEAEFKPVLDLIAGAKSGALFLMFMPGGSPLLEALLDRAKANDIYVRGVVSTVTPKGDIVNIGGQVVKSGSDPSDFKDRVIVPSGIKSENKPSWAEVEFGVGQIKAQHMMAIVHSKVIVVDPFSDDCAVITGSHNFSDAASKKNDENLVIIRGNKMLAQAYALHINGVYDHYSWRTFLANGGDPDQIFKPLDGWKSNGSRAKELDFWMT